MNTEFRDDAVKSKVNELLEDQDCSLNETQYGVVV